MGKAVTIYCEVLKNNEWVPSDFGFGYDEKGEICHSLDSSTMSGLLGAYSFDNSIKFIEPLRKYKLPENISKEAKQCFHNNQNEDDCFYSWHTLNELLKFDWEQLSTERDNNGQFEPYKESGSTFFNLVSKLKTKGLPEEIRIIYWVNQ